MNAELGALDDELAAETSKMQDECGQAPDSILTCRLSNSLCMPAP